MTPTIIKALRYSIVTTALLASGASAQSDPSTDQGDLGRAQRPTGLGSERKASDKELARMADYLDRRYPASAVAHRYRTRADETVECVDYNEQPGMRSGRPVGVGRKPSKGDTQVVHVAEDSVQWPDEAGSLDGEGHTRKCPAHTVPILRPNLEVMARSPSLEDYLQADKPNHGGEGQHFHAARRDVGIANLGAETYLNTWDPYSELTAEFSLSQLWVFRGDGSNTETVEAGYQQLQQKYGDWVPHWFIYATPDNYGSGGCYNLDCGNFRQSAGSQLVIGGAVQGLSVDGGTQQVARMKYYFCAAAECGAWEGWWLYFQGGSIDEWVGYYPSSMFDTAGLRSQADKVQFGGEITDHNPTAMTATDMGNGNFPSATYANNFSHVAYQRSISVLTTASGWQSPALATTNITNAACYNLRNYSTASWGRHVYFGGSGKNSGCP